MKDFKLIAEFEPTGDQPQAIKELTQGVKRGLKHQVLLGVTGSGKTFAMASVIQNLQMPVLIISHNKTLAAQLYQEYREFFPNNAVEYFVSYYDYYQPEAYIPQTDTYIAKETDINEFIDKLRLSATTSLMTKKDVIVVASVSCIYNLGSPVEYGRRIIELKRGIKVEREDLLKRFTRLHYLRSDYDFQRATFRVKGETIDLWPAYEGYGLRLQFLGDKLEKIKKINPVTGKPLEEVEDTVIYPAKHFLTETQRFQKALKQIRSDLRERVKELNSQGKIVEAYRLEQRTNYDLELISEIGYCNGIENYSRYFDGRKEGEPPFTLLDYFPSSFLTIIDESHMTVPQLEGMYKGDLARKTALIEYGFRLPSCLDNRPLRLPEFLKSAPQIIYTSATPGEWEIKRSQENAKKHKSRAHSGVVEQLLRPTGLLDPEIEIRGTGNQIDNLVDEIIQRVERGERALVTTLTKRTAEDLASYLKEQDIKACYLHSDVQTLDRSDILENLRLGKYDVVVGINLLREGLDLPEVSLVVILDADREGFLRSTTSLIQVMGRAARHVNGKVIMYAEKITNSMRRAVDEIQRRRRFQENYNLKHNITPRSIQKPIREKVIIRKKPKEPEVTFKLEEEISLKDNKERIQYLSEEMRKAAEALEFEKAAYLRDKIREIKAEH